MSPAARLRLIYGQLCRCVYRVTIGKTTSARDTDSTRPARVSTFNTWTPDDPEYIVETGDVGA
jgi:hypothetical protein